MAQAPPSEIPLAQVQEEATGVVRRRQAAAAEEAERELRIQHEQLKDAAEKLLRKSLFRQVKQQEELEREHRILIDKMSAVTEQLVSVVNRKEADAATTQEQLRRIKEAHSRPAYGDRRLDAIMAEVGEKTDRNTIPQTHHTYPHKRFTPRLCGLWPCRRPCPRQTLSGPGSLWSAVARPCWTR